MKSPWVVGLTAILVFATTPAGADRQIEPRDEACSWITSLPLNEPDLAAVVKKVKAANLNKSEFETEAAFENRVSAPLADIQSALGGFIWASNRRIGEIANYDAENGSLSLRHSALMSIPNGIGKLPGGQGLKSLTQTTSRRRGKFLGQNAYGATAVVQQYEDSEIGIAFVGQRLDLNADIDNMFASLRLPLAPEDASKIKPNLEAVVAGKLVPPFVVESDSYDRATVDLPMDTQKHTTLLIIGSPCVMLRDHISGRVLAYFKFPAGI